MVKYYLFESGESFEIRHSGIETKEVGYRIWPLKDDKWKTLDNLKREFFRNTASRD